MVSFPVEVFEHPAARRITAAASPVVARYTGGGLT
jgi:hypothetical protein